MAGRPRLALTAAVLFSAGAGCVAAGEITVRAEDGVGLHVEVETGTGAKPPRLTVIFVAGTGVLDRDADFGLSSTPRDLVFKDLAGRMTARGVATVRYDVRGFRSGKPPTLDRALLGGRTTANMRGDLGAIYEWARSAAGLGATCVGFFAHSEGMLHVARLASQGAPPPALVIGMGAAMDSPVNTVRWQMTTRDAYSLALMDTNGDGMTTNDELRANIARTPSAVHGVVEPYIHPSGAWKPEDIEMLRATQSTIYAQFKSEVLAHADDAPYPNAYKATASYEWWKSWFRDDRSTAEQLAAWGAEIVLHYGDKDSQTPVEVQTAAAKAHLPLDKLKVHVHRDRGHTLGGDVLFGPIDAAIADAIADEAAAAACPPT
jgi:hypothetical protein